MSQKYEKLKTLLKELFQARPARPGLRPLPRDACQERRGVAVRRQGKAQGALGRSKFDGKKQDIRALLSKDVSKASIPKRSVASPAAPLAWSNLPSRWRSSSIYLFGLDTYGNALFSGDPYSQLYGVIAPELNDHTGGPFGGRDVVSVGDAFGETFLYYSTRNPVTGMMQRKVTFVKRVMFYGLPILIGVGYYPNEGVQPGSAGEGNGSPERPTGGDSRSSAGQGGSATLLYWQAPTILNPYLSSGTKDAEAASLVIEPLAEYNPNGEIVAVLATRVPTLENGGVSTDRTRITWNIRVHSQFVTHRC